MNLKDLKEPLPTDAVEWRISRSGQNNNGVWATAVAYKTSRADMDRLDEVCGPENWQDEYKPGPSGGVICGISIKVDGEWVTKWDGAENTTFEGVKGGLSDAFKRAGFKWGIGRYLYQIDETFVQTSVQKVDGWNYQSANSQKNIPAFYWQSPQLNNEPIERKNGNRPAHELFDTVVNQDGVPYKEIPSNKLSYMATALQKAINAFDPDLVDETQQDELSQLQLKLEAAKYYMGN